MLRKVGLKKVVPGVVEKPLEQQIREMLDADPIKGSWGGLNVVAGWRYNRITQSEDLSAAVWGKQNLDAPTRVEGGWKVVSQGGRSGFWQAPVLRSPYQAVNRVIRLKADTHRYVYVGSGTSAVGATLNLDYTAGFAVDLQNGVFIGAPPAGSSITDVGDGWFDIFVNFNTDIGAGQYYDGLSVTLCDENRLNVVSAGASIFFSRASAVLPDDSGKPYQRITDGVQDYYAYADRFPLLYQDSNGTLPITSMEQNVGLILDKCSLFNLGPERITGGDFSGGLIGTKVDGGTPASVSTWALETEQTIDGSPCGRLTITSSSSSYLPRIDLPGPPRVAGKTYFVEFDYKVLSGAPIISLVHSGSGTAATVKTLSGSGKFRAIYTATGTLNGEGIYFGNAVGDVLIDNISARLIDGNHASQSTPTKRMKISRRVNYTTSVPVNGTAQRLSGYFDGVEGLRLTRTATGDEVFFPFHTTSGLSGSRVHVSFLLDNATDAGGFLASVYTNIGNIILSRTTGVTPTAFFGAAVGGFSGVSAVAEHVYGTVFRYKYVVDFPVGTFAYCRTYIWAGAGLGVPGRIVGQVSAVLSQDAHLPFQQINSATDYDDDPRKFPTFLLPDVTDDAYVTPAMNFTGTDKLSVWVGMAKLDDSTYRALLELSSAPATTAGTFWVNVNPDIDPKGIWAALASSAAERSGVAFTKSAPVTGVLGAYYDFAGADRSSEIGVSWDGQDVEGVGGLAASAGAGPFGNHPMWIGARAGTSMFFNGRIYGWLVRPAASTQQQKDLVNRYYKQEMKLPS